MGPRDGVVVGEGVGEGVGVMEPVTVSVGEPLEVVVKEVEGREVEEGRSERVGVKERTCVAEERREVREEELTEGVPLA